MKNSKRVISYRPRRSMLVCIKPDLTLQPMRTMFDLMSLRQEGTVDSLPRSFWCSHLQGQGGFTTRISCQLVFEWIKRRDKDESQNARAQDSGRCLFSGQVTGAFYLRVFLLQLLDSAPMHTGNNFLAEVPEAGRYCRKLPSTRI